jgi:hypothetical protein
VDWADFHFTMSADSFGSSKLQFLSIAPRLGFRRFLILLLAPLSGGVRGGSILSFSIGARWLGAVSGPDPGGPYTCYVHFHLERSWDSVERRRRVWDEFGLSFEFVSTPGVHHGTKKSQVEVVGGWPRPGPGLV